MCILFILVGSTSSNDHESIPTIIANNRDEYYNRPTSTGKFNVRFDENRRRHFGRFLPFDAEGGGSWLGFDIPLSSNYSTARFAIVLNYHDWRNNLCSGEKPSLNDSTKLSRGLLVKNFLEHDSISSKAYVDSLVDTVDKYRPFNLIVGDGDAGVYFISSHHPFPQLLVEGRLYGLTNGEELLDFYAIVDTSQNSLVKRKWEKLSKGCTLMNEKVVGPIRRAVTSFEESIIQEGISVEASRAALLQEFRRISEIGCCEVMADSTPLADPDFGHSSAGVGQLAAIHVQPTVFLESVFNQEGGRGRCFAAMTEVSADIADHRIFGTRTTTFFVQWTPRITSNNLSSPTRMPIFCLMDRDLDCVRMKWVHREVAHSEIPFDKVT